MSVSKLGSGLGLLFLHSVARSEKERAADTAWVATALDARLPRPGQAGRCHSR